MPSRTDSGAEEPVLARGRCGERGVPAGCVSIARCGLYTEPPLAPLLWQPPKLAAPAAFLCPSVLPALWLHFLSSLLTICILQLSTGPSGPCPIPPPRWLLGPSIRSPPTLRPSVCPLGEVPCLGTPLRVLHHQPLTYIYMIET